MGRSMIAREELEHFLRQLPHGRNAKCGEFHFSHMRSAYAPYHYPARPMDHYSMTAGDYVDRITFSVSRERLNGAYVWVWTHGQLIVKVDV